ncbi:MAG: phosphatase PAP2 family protein, partial [Bdellovibrionaceae bacterium]|nr:phosphatase PAP2 family protein [Pseudobdellovibrionaceae bacterium]
LLLATNKERLLQHSLRVGSMALILATLSFFTLDQPVSSWFQHPQQTWLWLLGREVTNIGLAEPWIVLTITLLVVLRWVTPRIQRLQKHKERLGHLRNWSLCFLISLAASGVVIHVLKILTGRQRPHKTELANHDVFSPINFHWDFQSFPSGHSQTLMVVATMASILWPQGRLLFFTLGVALAFTRVMSTSHFISDVVIGCAIGYLGTLWCIYKLRNKFSLI